jgi:hypothetical protein
VKGIELIGPLLVLLCRIIGLVLGVVDICSLRAIVTLNHPAGSINHPASSVKTTCCSPTEDMNKNCSNSWSICWLCQSNRRICCESIWSGELETTGASRGFFWRVANQGVANPMQPTEPGQNLQHPSVRHPNLLIWRWSVKDEVYSPKPCLSWWHQ